MPGAILKGRRQPPWYNVRILEEERPDLLGPNGKLNLEVRRSESKTTNQSFLEALGGETLPDDNFR